MDGNNNMNPDNNNSENNYYGNNYNGNNYNGNNYNGNSYNSNNSDTNYSRNNYNGNSGRRRGSGNGGFFVLGLLLGALFCSIVVFAAFLLTGLKGPASATVNGLIDEEDASKIDTVKGMIDKYFYRSDVTEEDLKTGMLEGMLAALDDPYSEYYTETEMKSLRESISGTFYGIGAYISINNDTGYAAITGVIKETPAQAAGLREDDIIYMVDGESTAGLTLEEVVSRIKGEEGTMVHLTILRGTPQTQLEFDIKRGKIDSETVNYRILTKDDAPLVETEGLAYIQITEFDDVTPGQFETALKECRSQGMKGLIIDLRGNLGGTLDGVCEIARMMLPKGLIVYTETKEGKRTEYTCDGNQVLEVPLVVLVNGYSASASEILSGAIKDYGIGTLVGTTTYGKGVVQNIFSLSDGTALKLTVSSYYTPSGVNIHGKGIEPDIVCEFDSDAYYGTEEDEEAPKYDNQLDKAVEVLQRKLVTS